MKAPALALIGMFCVVGSLSAQEPLLLEPTAPLETAKVVNTLSGPVEVDYLFEDHTWRHVTIPPGRAIYFSESNPANELQVRYRSSGAIQQRKLETEPLYLQAPDGRTTNLDVSRNDQASPYHFGHDKSRRLVLYKGFPTAWVHQASAEAARAIRQSQLDISFLRDSIATDGDEMLVCEMEFRAAAERILQACGKVTPPNDAPALVLDWIEVGNPVRLVPRVRVAGCENPPGQLFVKKVLQHVIGPESLASELVMKTCSAMVFVGTGRLNPRYLHDGGLDVHLMALDMVGELSTSQFSADHIHDELGPSHRRICTVWKYAARGNSAYRWKLIIDTEAEQQDVTNYGIKLSSNLVAQKRMGSDTWEPLAQYQVYEFGKRLNETIVYEDEDTRDGTGASVSDGRESASVWLAKNVSSRLATMISGGAADSDPNEFAPIAPEPTLPTLPIIPGPTLPTPPIAPEPALP
jgi:hypothetical protein